MIYPLDIQKTAPHNRLILNSIIFIKLEFLFKQVYPLNINFIVNLFNLLFYFCLLLYICFIYCYIYLFIVISIYCYITIHLLFLLYQLLSRITDRKLANNHIMSGIFDYHIYLFMDCINTVIL